MFTIGAVSDGWRVLDGEDEVSAHPTMLEALDAALPSVVTGTKAPRLRDPDTGDLNGKWRWLPASDEDDKPLKGALLDAESLRQLAESLNTRPSPIAIDGGPTPPGMLPSEVHGTAYTGGGTAANGWAHYALVARGVDGKAELLVLAALLVPVVARELYAGRIATGSIHFTSDATDPDTGAAREMTFRSHALTNDPADVSLNSANAARRLSPGRASMRSHFGEAHMTKPVRSAAVLALGASFLAMANARGASGDALAKLYGMFGIAPDDPDASYKLSDSVYALRESAKAENAAAAINGSGGTEVTQSARTEGDVPDPKTDDASAAGRALDDADAMLLSGFAEVARAIPGTPDADMASALDGLKAAQEKLAGALAAAPTGGDQDGGQASVTPPDAEARSAGQRAGLEALRSGLASLRSENKTLSTQLEGLKPVREAHARSVAAEAVDADALVRGRGLAGKGRDAMIAAKLQGEVAYQAAWAVLTAPLTADVTRAAGSTGTDARTGGGGATGTNVPASSTATTARAAIDARAEELRAAGDTSLPHMRVAAADRQLRIERPELFTS